MYKRQVVYVAVHKLGSRDIAVQEKLREIEFEICKQYGVTVADIYDCLLYTSSDHSLDYAMYVPATAAEIEDIFASALALSLIHICTDGLPLHFYICKE